MSWLSVVTGVVFLLIGLNQFRDARLGGLRDAGLIDADGGAEDISQVEYVFGRLTGVGLILIAIFFLWIGGVIPLGKVL